MADETSVWIRTAPDIDGTYRPVLEIDDDTSYPLTAKSAVVYANEILHAAAIADYEAAVLAQMTKVSNVEATIAAQVIGELRADRPDTKPLTPLRLIPGVSAFTGEAFLTVEIKGRVVGQWTPAAAREHARFALEAVHVANLDSAYLRWLRSGPNIEEHRARVIVEDLANFRGDGP